MDSLVQILTDLKNNHYARGVKIEFESEGASLEDAALLKQLANNVGLDFIVKIGGCGALKDIRETYKLKTNSIVAPMIESAYALEKYICTLKTIFSENDIKGIKLYINIETISGFNALDEIISNNYFKYITGIIYGRGDMAGSLNIKDSEDKTILDMGINIADKMTLLNKEFIVGGQITPKSFEFIKKLPTQKYETRKIVFEKINNIESIIKALEFEILWIQNKNTKYSEDEKRLIELKKRYKNFSNKII